MFAAFQNQLHMQAPVTCLQRLWLTRCTISSITSSLNCRQNVATVSTLNCHLRYLIHYHSVPENESANWWQGFLCCHTPCLESAGDRLETLAFDCFIQEQYLVSCCLHREHCVNSGMCHRSECRGHTTSHCRYCYSRYLKPRSHSLICRQTTFLST